MLDKIPNMTTRRHRTDSQTTFKTRLRCPQARTLLMNGRLHGIGCAACQMFFMPHEIHESFSDALSGVEMLESRDTAVGSSQKKAITTIEHDQATRSSSACMAPKRLWWTFLCVHHLNLHVCL